MLLFNILTPGLRLISGYLLQSGQVVELCVADLLLQHQMLEVLSCLRLPLEGLKGLNKHTKRFNNEAIY